MHDAPNWIPDSYTGISDAFALFFELKFPNCGLLAFASEKKLEVETKGRLRSDVLERLSSKYEDALDDAAESFRNALSSDELRGIVRDPLSGRFGYIHRSSWNIYPEADAGADFLRCNYVGPGDGISDFGPDTRFRGERQPVLVSTEALQGWLSMKFPDMELSNRVRAVRSKSPASSESTIGPSPTSVDRAKNSRPMKQKTVRIIQIAVKSLQENNIDVINYTVNRRNDLLNKEMTRLFGRTASDRTFSEFFLRHYATAPVKE